MGRMKLKWCWNGVTTNLKESLVPATIVIEVNDDRLRENLARRIRQSCNIQAKKRFDQENIEIPFP
jgi:hypothetical protein